jgi:hypothetical protein
MTPCLFPSGLKDGLECFLGSLVRREARPFVIASSMRAARVVEIATSLPKPIVASTRHSPA